MKREKISESNRLFIEERVGGYGRRQSWQPNTATVDNREPRPTTQQKQLHSHITLMSLLRWSAFATLKPSTVRALAMLYSGNSTRTTIAGDVVVQVYGRSARYPTRIDDVNRRSRNSLPSPRRSRLLLIIFLVVFRVGVHGVNFHGIITTARNFIVSRAAERATLSRAVLIEVVVGLAAPTPENVYICRAGCGKT